MSQSAKTRLSEILAVHDQAILRAWTERQLESVATRRDLMSEAEAVAEARGTTKSELVREALRRQVALEQLRTLQRYGRRQAEERGVGPDDAESLVDELRGERD